MLEKQIEDTLSIWTPVPANDPEALAFRAATELLERQWEAEKSFIRIAESDYVFENLALALSGNYRGRRCLSAVRRLYRQRGDKTGKDRSSFLKDLI